MSVERRGRAEYPLKHVEYHPGTICAHVRLYAYKASEAVEECQVEIGRTLNGGVKRRNRVGHEVEENFVGLPFRHYNTEKLGQEHRHRHLYRVGMYGRQSSHGAHVAHCGQLTGSTQVGYTLNHTKRHCQRPAAGGFAPVACGHHHRQSYALAAV